MEVYSDLLGPLIVGIIIGRYYFNWRREVHTKKQLAAYSVENEKTASTPIEEVESTEQDIQAKYAAISNTWKNKEVEVENMNIGKRVVTRKQLAWLGLVIGLTTLLAANFIDGGIGIIQSLKI